MSPIDPPHEQRPVESLLKHDRWLRTLAARLTRNYTEAEDLLQGTWLAALRSPPADWKRNPRGWLRRVLENEQRQSRRSHQRRAWRELEAGSNREEALTEERLELQLDLRRQLLDEIRALDERHRRVLVLRYFEGHSLRKIAQLTGTPRDTVKSQHARAIQLLRARLERRDIRGVTWLGAYAALAPSFPWRPLLLMKSTTKIVGGVCAMLLVALTATLIVSGNEERRAAEEPAGPGAKLERQTETAAAPDALAAEVSARKNAGPGPAPAALAAEIRMLDGRVLTHDGSPIPGARVEGGGQVVLADGHGNFRWPATDRAVLLTPRADGMTAVLRGWARPETELTLTLVLAPSLHLAGEVVDGKGAPLAGASVFVRLEETWTRQLPLNLAGGTTATWTATTDAAGVFDLASVPAIEDGLLWARSGPRTSLYVLPMESRSDLRLVLSEASLDERWAGIPHLSGIVLDSAGSAVPSARIQASDFATDADAAGLFRVPLSALDVGVELLVMGHGHLPARVQRPDSGWPDRIEVRLPAQKLGAIGGRVLGLHGEPLAGRRVWLADPSPCSADPSTEWIEQRVGQRSTTTDGEGRFRLTALPGRTYIASAFDQEALQRVDSAPAMAGDHALELVIDTLRESIRLSGRCLDLRGKPVVGVEVTPQWTVPFDGGSRMHTSGGARTDETGRFELEGLTSSFDSLQVEGPGIVPQTLPCSLEVLRSGLLVVARRARIRVATSMDEATHFTLEAEPGELAQLYRFQWIINGTFEGADITHWGLLEQGRSSTYTVAEGSYQVRLYENDRELRTLPVRLAAGDLTEIPFD